MPHTWYQHPLLRTPANKPNKVAIDLLADIVYWYRPVVLRDETTGRVVERRKKFEADRWRIDYKQWAALRGYGKRQVQDAANFLKSRGIVTIEVKHYDTPNGFTLYNAVFIEPIPKVLADLNKTAAEREIHVPKKRDTSPVKTGRPENKGDSARKSGAGATKKRAPRTKNTPETSAKTTTTLVAAVKKPSCVKTTKAEIEELTERLLKLRVSPTRAEYLVQRFPVETRAAVAWWETNPEYLNSRSKPGGAVAASIEAPEKYPQVYAPAEPLAKPAAPRKTKADLRKEHAAAYEKVWQSLPAALRKTLEREDKDRFEYLDKHHPNDVALAIRARR